MKKRIALALLTLALLATPLVYVACPESQAADGSTPWPGLYVGSTYTFLMNGDHATRITVEGYDGEYVYGSGKYVNMYNVCCYY